MSERQTFYVMAQKLAPAKDVPADRWMGTFGLVEFYCPVYAASASKALDEAQGSYLTLRNASLADLDLLRWSIEPGSAA